MLENPGFEGGTQGWQAFGAARYEIVAGAGRIGSAALRYRKDRDEGKENSHFDQEVDVDPKTLYVAVAYFKGDGVLRPALRIASMDWQTMALGVSKASTDWQEVRVPFYSRDNKRVRVQIFGGALTDKRESAVGASYCDAVFLRKATEEECREARRCRIKVDTGTVLREISPLFFGVNFLFMVEDDASRADGKIEKLLREMPCRLIRFPGGEMADNYHWKTHRLDNPKRWPMREGPDTTDTDEFMAWCRRIGAEPIFVVNLESGFVHNDVDAGVREAAEWVKYCNKEKGYGVNYWEIGNETYLKGTLYPLKAKQYADAFVKFSRAMKAVDPTIKVGAIGPMWVKAVAPIDKDEGVPWWESVVRIAGRDLDFAVVHRYYSDRGFENFAWNPVKVGEPVAELRQFLREQMPGRTIEIALTEWNTWKKSKLTGMAHGLVMAEMMVRYIEGGVDLANFWPFRNTGKRSNFRAMLDRETNEPLPPYHVMKLFSSNIGRRLVKSTSSNVQVVSLASCDGDGKTLCVFLINKSVRPEGVEVELRVTGRDFANTKGMVLAAPALLSMDLSLRDLDVKKHWDCWASHLPPHSIGVVTLSR
ncbi:MAG: hypothetical protein GXP25_11680 [Planctomycetes bacterium]|nr:hypothetical protein [Planctomycetota bacterium]